MILMLWILSNSTTGAFITRLSSLRTYCTVTVRILELRIAIKKQKEKNREKRIPTKV